MASFTQTAIAELSPEERLTLIEALWDSLADADVHLPETQRAELDRRLATFESDKAQSVPWETLKAELRSRST